MKLSRLKIAKNDIQNLFDSVTSKVLTRSQIDKIFSQNRAFWRASSSTSTQGFIDFLLKETKLKAVKFDFPSRKMNRYIWGEASTLEIILSLKPNSYFSHYTAVYLHELTEQIPKTYYLNFEQLAKHDLDTQFTQQRIDSAFKQPWRVSNAVTDYNDIRICILNGMHTGRLGVIDIAGPNGEIVPVTNVERTLIDIAVRPVYAGGVFEVLKAYKLAYLKVSINKLTAMLGRLNYKYPYHQVIGLYLDKAGVYKDSQMELLHNQEMKFDFYLTHQMKDMDYSKKWHLFFPKGF
jgi:hypothetical protein